MSKLRAGLFVCLLLFLSGCGSKTKDEPLQETFFRAVELNLLASDIESEITNARTGENLRDPKIEVQQSGDAAELLLRVSYVFEEEIPRLREITARQLSQRGIDRIEIAPIFQKESKGEKPSKVWNREGERFFVEADRAE